MPLRTWFAVAWFVTSQKDGASALGLQNALGIKSYQTVSNFLAVSKWMNPISVAVMRAEKEDGVVKRRLLWLLLLNSIRQKDLVEFACNESRM